MSTASVGLESSSSFGIEAALCADHGLHLERLPQYGWLVRRVDVGADRPVIGCIDDLGQTVELMEMDGGFHWSTHDSLHDALTHLFSSLPHTDEDRILPDLFRH